MFHYADDTNVLGFRTESERFTEMIKFRTEPIPKKFLHSVPNRTEIWKSIPHTPNIDDRSQFKVHTDEQTQVHSTRRSLEVHQSNY